MKGELGENGYTYMYSWMPSLFTCYHNIINWLSVQFSHSVMSDSLWPRGLQHARPLCPSPTPRASNPLLSSVIPFPSCLQSFPASGSFPKSQFSASGGQSIGVSASASVLPMNIQDWNSVNSFSIDWFDLLAGQGPFKSLLQHHNSKASILRCSAFFMVQLSYPYMTTGKTIALTIWTFDSKVTAVLFNILFWDSQKSFSAP